MTQSVEIFISHKHEDKTIATTVKRELELVSSRINCFVSEQISSGAEWFDKIRESLEKADILLLIFTASTSQWDWPLYEVGLATDLSEPERCRIICLYPPGASPPEPIKAFQAVEASPEGLERFLHQLFCTTDLVDVQPVLNERLQEGKNLQRLAEELSGCFTTVKPWENCFTNYLWVDVDNVLENEEIEAQRVPGSATIDPKSTALKLFGLATRPPGDDLWRWDQLLDRVDQADGSWVTALGERFKWASEGSTLKSMTALFTSPHDGRPYRPVLHRVKLHRDASMRFEVIFVEKEAAAADGAE